MSRGALAELGLEDADAPIRMAIGRRSWRALGEVDALRGDQSAVVAWKKVGVAPLVALVMALLRGRICILHDGRRRRGW